jgi:hypothetical protein
MATEKNTPGREGDLAYARALNIDLDADLN